MENNTSAAQPEAPTDRRPFRIPRWLMGVLAACVLACVFGFYLPAIGALDVQQSEFEVLTGEYKSAVAAFERTSEELSDLRDISAKQEGALGKISAAESTAERALEALHRSVVESLQAQIEGKLLTVKKGEDAVTISIESMFLVYPHKTFVHAQGEALLCQIAKVIPSGSSEPTDIIAHANSAKPTSRLVERQFPTSWQLSGILASEVADKMQTCGVAGKELRAVGAAHYQGDTKKARKSAARFEIIVRPP